MSKKTKDAARMVGEDVRYFHRFYGRMRRDQSTLFCDLKVVMKEYKRLRKENKALRAKVLEMSEWADDYDFGLEEAERTLRKYEALADSLWKGPQIMRPPHDLRAVVRLLDAIAGRKRKTDG